MASIHTFLLVESILWLLWCYVVGRWFYIQKPASSFFLQLWSYKLQLLKLVMSCSCWHSFLLMLGCCLYDAMADDFIVQNQHHEKSYNCGVALFNCCNYLEYWFCLLQSTHSWCWEHLVACMMLVGWWFYIQN